MAVRDECPLFVPETGRISSSARQGGFGGLWAWAVETRAQLSMSLDGVLGFFQLAPMGMYILLLVFLLSPYPLNFLIFLFPNCFSIPKSSNRYDEVINVPKTVSNERSKKGKHPFAPGA